MSLADAIAASTPASTSTATAAGAKFNRKSTTSSVVKNEDGRPRNNSPAFQAYEDKKKACDARINDIRARIVNPNMNYPFHLSIIVGCHYERLFNGRWREFE